MGIRIDPLPRSPSALRRIARLAVLVSIVLILPVHLASVSHAGTFTFPVQSEQLVLGSSTGIAGSQVDDGARELLSEADTAPDTSSAPGGTSARVQNGSASLVAGATSVDVAIAPVVMSRAFLTFSASFDDPNPGGGQVSGRIANPTTVRFERMATGAVITLKWYVAEFASGVAVQRGTANMTGALLDIPITAVNLARSFPIVSYRVAGTAYGDNDFLRAKLTSSTNLQITVFGGVGGSSEWQVVEYTGSSVQTGDLSFAAGDASLSATVTAVSVPKAWLLFSYTSSSGTGTNIAQKMVWGTVTDATTLTFDRTSTGQSIDLTWYLVEFTDATTVEAGSTQETTAQTQLDVPIVCVDTLTTLATAGGMSYRGGSTPYTTDDNPGVSSVTLDLTSGTNLRITRGLTGGVTATIGWFVVRFAGYPGCRIIGTYPADIASEDGTFLQYREGLSSSTNHYPVTQTITTGGNCGGTFPSEVRSSNDGYLCLREMLTSSIAFDASSSTSGNSGSFTWAHTTGGTNRLLIVGVTIQINTGQTVSSVTYAGSALTFVRADAVAGSVRSELWYRIAPATGSNNLVVTLSASARAAAGAITLTGVDQTTPVDAQNGATGTSVTPSVTVTTVTDGAWVVDVLGFRGTGNGVPTGNPGSGQTQRWSQYVESGGTVRGKASTEGPRTPAGAVVMDWSLSASVDWAITGIAVRPTDARITVQHDFAAVPAGDAYDLCVEAYLANAAGESMLLQVLTPPATWNTRIAVSKTVDDDLAQCSTLTATEYNGGAVSLRWIGGTENGDGTISDLRIDQERIVRRFTNYRLDLRYDWTGVPAGDAYVLRVRGYRSNEDVTVQVLTPPTTWNTRFTVSSVANQVFTAALTPAEYNGGAPAIRFVDAVPAPDGSASDLLLDGVSVTTLHLSYSLDVLQNITGVAAMPNPVLVVKGNVTAGGENFDVHLWNFTSSVWDVLFLGPFTAVNAYHNASLAAAYSSAGTVRLRFLDAGSQDLVQGALSLDLVAVVITNAEPTLTNDGVSPGSGTITTTFTFFVRYTDVENEGPAFVNLTLDGVPYAMTENSSADTNYADGKDYFLDRVIGVRGTLDFFFSTRASAGVVVLVTTPVRQVSVGNRAPTITNPIASDAVHTGASYTRDFNASDPDNDTLTWSIVTNASWLAIGPANGTVWGRAPVAPASFFVDVRPDDGFGGVASDNYTLSAGNGAPSITNPILSDGVHLGRPYVRDFAGSDPEGDPPLWSMSTNASWLAIGAGNGTVWGSAPVILSVYYVAIGLADGFGGSASLNYSLTVGNVAPAITTPASNIVTFRRASIVRDFDASDPDVDVLAWSLSTNASFLSLGPSNGTVSGTAPNVPSTFWVEVTVSDGFGGVDRVNVTLSVINRPPQASLIAPATAMENTTYQGTFAGTDPDLDTLTWSFATNAPWITFDPVNGTFSGTAVAGVYYVNVTARDPYGGVASQNLSITISPIPPPSIVPGLATVTLGVLALGIAAFVAATPRRRKDLEQAFLLDASGSIRVRYDGPGAPFDETRLLSLLSAHDRQRIDRISADPHTLHIVRRTEGEWILVSRSQDAARVVKAAEPLFISSRTGWPAPVPPASNPVESEPAESDEPEPTEPEP